MNMRQLISFATGTLLSRLPSFRTSEGMDKADHERDAEWYDISYKLFKHWKKHYTNSHYYFLWSIVIDRLLTHGCDCILDVGCGPGQFACLASDRGITQYHGLDFSKERIRQARLLCPHHDFYIEDAFKTDKFSTIHYDGVVMTEVLEHVENDLGLIQRIRPGVRLLASVPNFTSAGHVRFFNSVEDVRDRYSSLLHDLRIDALKADERGRIYYLIDGVVRNK